MRWLSLGLALLLVGSASAARPNWIRIHGALVTRDGAPAKFRGRAHWFGGREQTNSYVGRFWCRGPGCPLHRGRVRIPLGGTQFVFTSFRVSAIRGVICLHRTPLTDTYPPWELAGEYSCERELPVGYEIFSVGMLDLIVTPRSRP